jgi:hypothetical protein
MDSDAWTLGPFDPETDAGHDAVDLPDEVASASCPYCGEVVELSVDPGGRAHQEYVEDCPVCCRPWRVRVQWQGGSAVAVLETEDG